MSSVAVLVRSRITSGVPLLVTVAVHVVLLGIAGYFVSERVTGSRKPDFEGRALPDTTPPKASPRFTLSRGSGGAAMSSPISVQRIIAAVPTALALPVMAELVQPGGSVLGGSGFSPNVGGIGNGPGPGIYTGNGPIPSGGQTFMSQKIFGQIGPHQSKVMFVVEAGPGLLDIRKGGFPAFAIIREQMARLVAELPPGAEFGVVFFERDNWRANSVTAFDDKLRPATAANKQAFLDWLRPVNATPEIIGVKSVPGRRIDWHAKDLSSAGVDELLRPPAWARCLQFALEMQPDTIFMIVGGVGDIRRSATPAELERMKREYEERLSEMARGGLDIEAINQARSRFLAKARDELKEINRKLSGRGKPPYIITDIRRVFDADFQADLKRNGFSLALNTAGWADKKGRPVWGVWQADSKAVPFSDLTQHLSKLKRVLTTKPITLNCFLFVGPDEQPRAAMDDLGDLARKNNGRFELLTTKRLQEIVAREEPKQ
ncbi:MAG: hypothetical protein WC205_06870 [Opitutaceae bacterium]|jgi:hypothetical protein